jgi:hypothetical protein
LISAATAQGVHEGRAAFRGQAVPHGRGSHKSMTFFGQRYANDRERLQSVSALIIGICATIQ